ncbi:sigma-70 family RNA polymerase sigma factor [Lentzea sp. BCCO 10_0061]|uniref:Sigma-70 family RNA polymerase sigma factor n=1 Tax=Lentzea sokolovensis TaxID=3095429 RepID=A0ABU4V869_9PSEU|nr:sigma-70 family RNA polymerase sigma factor [Lentzea sp. BCCO 10_0061]MDX8147409.1 sigma-70 family RNA polymerase sigma factor [Lentzea sp. BCCO 10_0061]
MRAGPEHAGAADARGLSPDDDQELWEQAASGDVAAFGELFRRHSGAVWNYAYRLTGSWSVAEDLTSAAFLTACRRLGDLTLVNRSARPWLFAVTGNLARREHRGRGRFAAALARLPRGGSTRDHADDVADKVDADHRLREVLDAVAKLPKAEREAVELCLIGGLSTAAAAAVLGVAEASIRSRISRARSRLRDTTLDATTPEER